jgi:hypothetical protein
VRCDCGTEKAIQLDNLARTRSCGCIKREMLAAKATHRMSKSPEYRVWAHMIDRCTRVAREDFARYGARGITVCTRWLDAFEHFLADMGPRPTPKHSIDRIDNALGYTPENCRWATAKTQRINQRRQVLHTHNGITGTLKDLAHYAGLSYSAVHQRVAKQRWSVHRALSTPVQKRTSK